MRRGRKCREHLSWIRGYLSLFSLKGNETNHGEGPEESAKVVKPCQGKLLVKLGNDWKTLEQIDKKAPKSHRPIDPK